MQMQTSTQTPSKQIPWIKETNEQYHSSATTTSSSPGNKCPSLKIFLPLPPTEVNEFADDEEVDPVEPEEGERVFFSLGAMSEPRVGEAGVLAVMVRISGESGRKDWGS